MTITQAEHLQRDLTDKFVVVQPGVAELMRFEGLTGTVKTVNMSGRALVQFDGPVDISWYDIDPAYLQVVDAPQPKKKAAGHEAKSSPKEAPAAKPPAAKGGGSPLDQIRKQGAPNPANAAPAASGGAKPSPLDLIRRQGAAKTADAPADPAAAPETPPQETAPTSATPAAPPAGMSPLDLIRKQGAAKK